MYGLIRTLPVSPPPVVGSVALNSGSVAFVSAPSVTPFVAALTTPVVWSGLPEASTSSNEPVSASPPLCDGAVAVVGVSVTEPTKAPAGIPVPVTERPSSVITAELSAMVELPVGAVAPLSFRAPGEWLPPPRMHDPAGCGAGRQLFGRSMSALSPGPG